MKTVRISQVKKLKGYIIISLILQKLLEPKKKNMLLFLKARNEIKDYCIGFIEEYLNENA
ncbi:hypothetical protein [Oceanihabitans sediminis]|uniref:hypothetical protein n=1 Tax=Oceanihabitans sediminis TaxID=1812012 RepID=UPI00299EFB3C|nr:hypothetical protein [Oceanihabitans sediminis]